MEATTRRRPSPAAVASAEVRAGMEFMKAKESILEGLKAADKNGAAEVSPPLSRAAHNARLAATALDDALTALASEELV